MAEPPAPASDPPLVVVIVGPTAVGKTEVAVALCEAVGGEIVSLDSRQMYRYLDIGSAKPTAVERARAPHHLVDVVDPSETLTLADVQGMAYEAIHDIAARSGLPILVGGAGQYIRAVVEGWQVPRVPPDPDRRAALEARAAHHGPDWLHRRLAEVDPVSAARIDARNVRRVIRALEVFEATGERISTLQARAAPPFQMHLVGLHRSRPVLYDRIDRRIDTMLRDGLEDEVRGLLARGYTFDLPAMSGVGYGEWRGLIEGIYELDEVVRRMRHNTRRLVRGQATWFRRDDARIQWLDLELVSVAMVVGELSALVQRR